jgi:putative ABC transport system permease protein
MALGMTLAMIVTVASIRETVRVWVESTLRSDLWIKADAGRGSGLVGDLPEDVIAFVRDFEGVAAVDPFRARDATDAKGRPYTLGRGDFRVLARAGGLPMLDGADPSASRARRPRARRRPRLGALRPAIRCAARLDRSCCRRRTGPRKFTVAGVYRDYSNDRGTVVMDRDLYLTLYPDRRVTSVAAIAKPGVDAADLRRRILAAAQGRYALSISTNRDLRREALRIFDRTFAVTRGARSDRDRGRRPRDRQRAPRVGRSSGGAPSGC